MKFDKHIPIPPKGGSHYAFHEMIAGDSFFLPNRDSNRFNWCSSCKREGVYVRHRPIGNAKRASMRDF